MFRTVSCCCLLLAASVAQVRADSATLDSLVQKVCRTADDAADLAEIKQLEERIYEVTRQLLAETLLARERLTGIERELKVNRMLADIRRDLTDAFEKHALVSRQMAGQVRQYMLNMLEAERLRGQLSAPGEPPGADDAGSREAREREIAELENTPRPLASQEWVTTYVNLINFLEEERADGSVFLEKKEVEGWTYEERYYQNLLRADQYLTEELERNRQILDSYVESIGELNHRYAQQHAEWQDTLGRLEVMQVLMARVEPCIAERSRGIEGYWVMHCSRPDDPGMSSCGYGSFAFTFGEDGSTGIGRTLLRPVCVLGGPLRECPADNPVAITEVGGGVTGTRLDVTVRYRLKSEKDVPDIGEFRFTGSTEKTGEHPYVSWSGSGPLTAQELHMRDVPEKRYIIHCEGSWDSEWDVDQANARCSP
jgi:hypothetical protein